MATPGPGSKATIAGVLDITAGALSLLGAVVLLVIGLVGSSAMGLSGEREAEALFFLPLAVFVPLALLSFAIGVLAVVGGVAALRRRRMWLAMAGAVAAVFAFFLLGIPAVILTILAEKEFERG